MIDSDERFERLTIQHVISTGAEQAVAELGISIVTTQPGTSGERRWFQCPRNKCGRRCSTLYLAEEGLVCSACARASPEKQHNQPCGQLQKRPANLDVRAARIKRNHVPPAPPPSTAETRGTAVAIRMDGPPRQLVEAFRRIAVSRVLARFGLPVSLNDGSGLHVCRVSETQHFVMLPTAQHNGGVRWWFRCNACLQRCGRLYSPRSANGWDLRCRRCWNLTYRSQRS